MERKARMVTNPTKIAMLSVHSCPLGKLGEKDTGGMSVYVREIACELGKRGHLVDVYTRVHVKEHDRIMKLGPNVRLIHLKAGEDEYVNKLAVYLDLPDFSCQVERFRKYHNLEYDLVFSHYWLSAWVGKLLQSWWDVPHVTMFHTLGAVKNTVGIGEDEPELRVETEKYLVKSCDRVIAATEKEKNDIILHSGVSPEKVSIIPCGVNLDAFHPVDRQLARQQLGYSEGKTILFVGRLEPLKGIDKLIMAMGCLGGGRGLRLVVIGGGGNGQYDMELSKLSQQLNLEGSVDFLGLVKHEELPGFYSAADVCVVPSYYESFGLVALESLACGTLVVSTNVGGAASVIRHGENGYLAVDNAPRHLAEGIAFLLSGTGISAESREAIRASVAGFNWSNIAAAVESECLALRVGYSRRYQPGVI